MAEARPVPPIHLAASPLPPPTGDASAFTVLDITKSYGATSGGVKTYLREKGRYMAEHGELRHVVVVPGAEDSVEDDGATRWYRLRGAPVPFQRPYRFLLSAAKVGRIARHERPAVVEVGSPFFVPWVTHRALRDMPVSRVWFYHGHLPGILPAPAWLTRRYVRRVSRLFDRVIAASGFAAAALRSYGIDNVVQVPLGVDLDVFRPGRRAVRAGVRDRLDAGDGPLVLYAGRIAGEKGLGVILEAWREVERRSGATLVLLGAGPSEARYRARAGGSRVRWLPYEQDRERFADLLAACDLYLAPGPNETFGLSVLEAMATGIPVASVDAGGGAELVRRAGAGELFRATARDAAAAILRGLAGGTPSARVREWVEREHGWEHVFDRLFQVYREVAGHPAPAGVR